MKKSWWISIAAVLCCAFAFAQASYVGNWSGSWEGGGGTGRFDLKLNRDGTALSGGVSVGSDQGDYEATFTSVAIDGNKLTARYDYTPDPQAEIVLSATFDGNAAKGTWGMVPKGQNTPGLEGTWTVTKK